MASHRIDMTRETAIQTIDEHGICIVQIAQTSNAAMLQPQQGERQGR